MFPFPCRGEGFRHKTLGFTDNLSPKSYPWGTLRECPYLQFLTLKTRPRPAPEEQTVELSPIPLLFKWEGQVTVAILALLKMLAIAQVVIVSYVP